MLYIHYDFLEKITQEDFKLKKHAQANSWVVSPVHVEESGDTSSNFIAAHKALNW
jgi:hypothetical protein